MKHSFFSSIRTHLLLLVLISILPALGIIIYSGIDRRNVEIKEAEDNVLKVLQALANDHERAVDSTHQFLMALARLPDLQNMNITATNSLFGELLKQNPLYGNIFVVNAEGMLCASALPFTKQSLKYRKYFQDILKVKTLSSGEYTIGVTVKRPVLHFAYPMLDARGQFKGVIAVAFDLARYSQIFAKTKLLAGSVFGMFDHRHMRLYRYPDTEKYVGKVDSAVMIMHMSAGPAEGVFTEVGVDGIKYLHAYKRFYMNGSTSPYLFIRVGIPYEKAFAHARKYFFINIALLCVAFIVAMASAWFVGNIVIARRLDKLAHASQQLAHGDLTIRTGLAHKKDELGKVAEAFDEMVAILEQKDSQRKLAAEALKQSEEKYRSIFENAVEGVFQSTPEGRFISVNPALVRIHGYESPEEMITTVTDIGSQLYVDSAERANYKKMLDEYGTVTNFEHRSYKKDGSIIWISLSTRTVKDASGKIVCYEGTVEDITERKHAEKLLKQEKETLSTILESDPCGIAVVGRNGAYRYVNPEFTKITGYTLADIKTGKDWFQKTCPDPQYRKKIIELWKKDIKKEGESIDAEYAIICKDGSRKNIEFRTTLLQDLSISVLNDITERRQAENLLKESEERYRTLTEDSMVGVYLVQKNLFRYVNNAFAQIHGYAPVEMVDKLGPMDFILPEDVPFVTENLKKQKVHGVNGAQFSLRIRRRDGAIRYAEVFVAPSLHKGAPALLGTFLDITERKELEEKLRTMSIVDDLTGLYNRRGFFTLVQQQFKLSERTPRGMILFFTDIDRMKWINDTLGHKEGDRALIDTASILRQTFRESDIIGRMGGDEFAILAIDATDETREALMERLQAILDNYNKPANRKYILSLSIGSTHYDNENPASLDELMAQADTMMYEEKKKKRN